MVPGPLPALDPGLVPPREQRLDVIQEEGPAEAATPPRGEGKATGERTPVTLRDIAVRLSISSATASRALNGRPGVSQELRREVRKVAKALGYVAGRQGRRTHPAPTSVVAFVTASLLPNDTFYPPILGAFQRRMQEQGMAVVVATVHTPGTDGADKEMEDLLADEWIRGVVFAGPHVPDGVIERVVAQGRPVVLVDNMLRGAPCDAVVPDNLYGAYDMTMHLVEHGARRLAFVGGPQSWYSTRERLFGFLGALHESHLQPHSVALGSGTAFTDGLLAGEELLASLDPPDSVVAVNDVVALGILATARNRGWAVPDTLRVCGFDDIEWAGLSQPPLSTCHIDLETVGTIAAERMLVALRRPASAPIPVPQRIAVAVRPVYRESCGCLAASMPSEQTGVSREGDV